MGLFQILGQVAVFHQCSAAVHRCHYAHALLGRGLGDHQRAHLGLRHEVRADHLRISRAHERVINLHGHDHVDAPLFQIAQHRGAAHGAEDAPMAIGRERQLIGSLTQDVARGGVNRGQHALHEGAHRAGVESKHRVLLEERHGLGVIPWRCHKQKRQVAPVVTTARPDARRVNGKQRVQGDGPDAEHALG